MYAPPNALDLLPQMLALSKGADRIDAHLCGLELLLRELVDNTTPAEQPVYQNASSQALESSHLVASGKARLFGFSGVNTNAAAQFILAFDRSVVPANGAVPDFVMKAPASDNFWVSWAPYWRDFMRGIVLCNSSTANTLTIGAADCFFDAQYDPEDLADCGD